MVQGRRVTVMYTLTDEHFSRDVITSADITLAADDGYDVPYEPGERVGPKFDSVATLFLWSWSLDSGQDEDCGESEYGNGWHALFRSERAVLHTNGQGFVYAWRIEPGKDVDTYWAEIESGAVYADDPEV
jgi:hypothetical protein